mgnify:CR=1 FL=1
MSIGKKIYMYLHANEISQTWLSENCGIALPKLNASLKEKRRITVDEFEKIINALNVDANTFIKSK